MELHQGIKTFHAKTRKTWRAWLAKHHQTEKSVWLIIYKKESKIPSVYYPEAVDEALCFGWIDSTLFQAGNFGVDYECKKARDPAEENRGDRCPRSEEHKSKPLPAMKK